MNKEKKLLLAKIEARNILMELLDKKYFDGFVTRYYTRTKCINYLEKNLNEYFKKNTRLLTWNKNTWINIFEDNNIVDALVWYMQDYNLMKEIEAENENKC